MSWLIFLVNLAKILFLDSHAKNLQVRTHLDVFLVSTMARSWPDLPRFSVFLIKMYQVSVHWVFIAKGKQLINVTLLGYTTSQQQA